MKNPYTKGLKKVRDAWEEGYLVGLLRAQELAKEHAVAIPIYINDADIDWEDFDQAIIEEAAKER